MSKEPLETNEKKKKIMKRWIKVLIIFSVNK